MKHTLQSMSANQLSQYQVRDLAALSWCSLYQCKMYIDAAYQTHYASVFHTRPPSELKVIHLPNIYEKKLNYHSCVTIAGSSEEKTVFSWFIWFVQHKVATIATSDQNLIYANESHLIQRHVNSTLFLTHFKDPFDMLQCN